jgi:hypothetical protein
MLAGRKERIPCNFRDGCQDLGTIFDTVFMYAVVFHADGNKTLKEGEIRNIDQEMRFTLSVVSPYMSPSLKEASTDSALEQ